MFFGFNLAGMVIQSGGVAVSKYGFNLNEADHKMVIMGITVGGIAVATIFRFWAYRTFVFLKPPVDGHESAIAELDMAAGLAELSAEGEPGSAAQLAAELEVDLELAAELDQQRSQQQG